MITVFTGKVRKAKQKEWKTKWYFHFSARNNEIRAAGEGYNKLASAVNGVEGILTDLKARFGAVVDVRHPDGVVEKLLFVSADDSRKERFAYHQRTYGKLVHDGETKLCQDS
jgi:uncharacterized protein YegP (UPF0339 family)